MVPQSWIINCHKMYKISYEVINFIDNTMKTRRVELTAGGRNIAEAKAQKSILQGDALSPLLFLITMIPLNFILRKCTAGYKLSKSQEKINLLMQVEDIKLFAKNEKELETNTRSENIHSGHWDGIWGRKIYNVSNEKRQTTPDERNGTAK